LRSFLFLFTMEKSARRFPLISHSPLITLSTGFRARAPPSRRSRMLAYSPPAAKEMLSPEVWLLDLKALLIKLSPFIRFRGLLFLEIARSHVLSCLIPVVQSSPMRPFFNPLVFCFGQKNKVWCVPTPRWPFNQTSYSASLLLPFLLRRTRYTSLS